MCIDSIFLLLKVLTVGRCYKDDNLASALFAVTYAPVALAVCS